jgi:hypothetical protein
MNIAFTIWEVVDIDAAVISINRTQIDRVEETGYLKF